MSRQGSRNVKDSTGREVPGSEEKEEEKRTQCFRESIFILIHATQRHSRSYIQLFIYKHYIAKSIHPPALTCI